jgi:hypothetical protein
MWKTQRMHTEITFYDLNGREPGQKWGNNIKMNLGEIVFEGVNWIRQV